MKKTRIKKFWKWCWWIAIIYAGIGIAFYFLQDRILFHPVALQRQHQYDFTAPHRDINLPVNDHDNLNIIDFSSTDTVVRGVVLYFHGNKKNISWYAKYIPYFTRNGYEVLMLDYPGFGKSTGRLTEKKLYDWALQVYKIAIKRFSADSIIIYGKSMGTGIAAQLASVRDCRRLVLETPYYDFPSVVNHYLPIYPVKWLLHYQIPTWQYIQNVRAPISLFHGTKDHVIVYNNSQRLKHYMKKEDELITIKGGRHNDLFTYPLTIAKLDSLLQFH